MDQWVYLAAGLLAFWSAVMLAKQFLPKSFEVHPFLVMWKTTKFNDFIDRLGRKLGRFWKILWTFGIALGFGAMAYITFILGRNLYYIFFSTESASPVSLIIPGITLSLNFNTLFFFGVSIAIILVTHELAHGVAARAEGVKVKSTGLLLMVLIPGAFVEPDEEDLNKARKSTQARVYAAGSATNILVGLLALLLLTNAGALISPMYSATPSGVLITEVAAGTPAYGILNNWDAITSINGTALTDINSLATVLNATLPNSTVPMAIIRGGEEMTINFTLGSTSKNISYIGINTYNYYAPHYGWAPVSMPYYGLGTLSWLYLFSLNIGLINMMPVAFFDGDKLVTIMLRFLFKDEKKAQPYANLIRWGCVALLVLNITISFVLFPGYKLG